MSYDYVFTGVDCEAAEICRRSEGRCVGDEVLCLRVLDELHHTRGCVGIWFVLCKLLGEVVLPNLL